MKVNDSNLSLALENYDAIHQILTTFGSSAHMFDEHGNSTLSLEEVHAL